MRCQMVGKDRFRDVLDALTTSKAAMRCQDLVSALQRLGFEVCAGRKQGHKIVLHRGIPNFWSDGFTCGHGRNPEVKPAYVTKIRKLLVRYETEIVNYLESTDER
jgi:hypothetical protein